MSFTIRLPWRRTFRDRVFTNARVHMDRDDFHRCEFRDCDLVYSGGKMVLVENKFFDARWCFKGKAANTLRLLKEINAMAPQIITETFCPRDAE